MKNISVNASSNNTFSSSTKEFDSKATEGIVWCTIFALEAVLIVLGNLLTIVLFTLNKKLRKKSFYLVISMAFADLMNGLVELPFYMYLQVGRYSQLWIPSLPDFGYMIDTIFLQTSLICAVMISCERYFSVYWPMKHRTLSTQAYRIAIFLTWTLAIILFAAIRLLQHYLISDQHTIYVWISLFLILLFIACSCNIGIWKKFQHGRISSQQQNRTAQTQRLTKSLLFVSSVALLSWLPLCIVNLIRQVHIVSIPLNIFQIAILFCYFNSLANPIVYALRIPEFRQAMKSCCFNSQATMDVADVDGN